MQPFAFKSARLGNSTVASLDSGGVQYLVSFELTGVYVLVRSWASSDNRLLRGDLALYRHPRTPKAEVVPPFTWD